MPMSPHPNRALFRTSVRYLVGRVPFEIEQVDGGALLVAETGQGCCEIVVPLAVFPGDRHGGLVRFIEGRSSLMPGTSMHIVAAIDGHPQKPRLQMAVIAEGHRGLKQTQEHGLEHVFGIGDAAHAACCQAQHHVSPAIDGGFQINGVLHG